MIDQNSREQRVAYVIAGSYIDVLERARIEECPLDCLYPGDRAPCRRPDECVDCGAAQLGRVGAEFPLVAGYPLDG